MRILFVPLGGEHYVSSRVRIYDYLPHYRDAQIQVGVVPWAATKSPPEQHAALLSLCEESRKYDVVYLLRVLLTKKQYDLLRENASNIVYDFDDAIYYVPSTQWPSWPGQALPALEYVKQAYRFVVRGGRFYSARKSTLDYMLSHADGVVAGNGFLADYALRFNQRVCIAPTPVDVDTIPMKSAGQQTPVVIGWIGTPYNLVYVENIAEALRQVSAKYGDRVLLRLCTAPADVRLKDVNWELVPWSIETQYQTLTSFDIGIMPLTDDGWSRSKCAYKALLYMAGGIPGVISPVGVNKQVLEEGVTGFFASSTQEWVIKLSALIEDAVLRRRMGDAARQFALSHYDRPVVFQTIKKFLSGLMAAP